jgi:hypothetical protein
MVAATEWLWFHPELISAGFPFHGRIVWNAHL